MNLPLIPATSSNKKSPKAFPSVVVTRGAQRGRRHRFGEYWMRGVDEGRRVGGGSKRIQLNVKGQSDQYSTLFRATYLLLTYWLLIIEIAKNQSLEGSAYRPTWTQITKLQQQPRYVSFYIYIFFYVNETLSACYLSPSFRPPVLPQSHHYWLSCLPFLMRPLQQWVVRRRQRQRKKEKKWPFKHWPSEPALPGKKEIDRSVQQGI